MEESNLLTKEKKFHVHEYLQLKEYLEKMALDGWLFKSLQCSEFTFERIEPKELFYLVEIYPYRGKRNTEQAKKEYLDHYRKAGWEPLSGNNGLFVFVSEADIPVPKEIDSAQKLNIIAASIIKQAVFSSGFIPSLITIMLMGGAKSLSFVFFSNVALAVFLMQIFLLIMQVFSIFRFTIWILIQKSRLKNGEVLDYNFQKNRAFLSAILFLILLFLLNFSMVELLSNTPNEKILLSSAFIVEVAFWGCYFLFKNGYKKTAITSTIICVAIGLGLGIAIVSAGDKKIEEQTTDSSFLASRTAYYDPYSYYVIRSDHKYVLDSFIFLIKHSFPFYEYSEFYSEDWNANVLHISYGEYVVYDDCVLDLIVRGHIDEEAIHKIRMHLGK